MILIEMTGAVDAAGTLKTFYLGESAFVTGANDTPPHTAFLPVLIEPGSIGLHAYSDGKTSGGSATLEVGELVVANANGQFDDWRTYGFDGRSIVIRSGQGGSYPADYPVVFSGTMEGVEANWKRMVVRLRDKAFALDVPVLSTRYAGTNVLPNGVEGTANDIKGKAKPRVFGTVFHVPAMLVNTSKLVYQVNDGAVAAIPAVYDRGGQLSPGLNFATSALLLASTPASGAYNYCLAEGLFMLGARATGTVTADVTQGATVADRTVGKVLAALAVAGGIPAGAVATEDIAALDLLNAAPVGLFVGDESATVRSAMDQVAASIGAWYAFDGEGKLRMGQLAEPTGAPVITLQDFDVGENIERRPARDNSVPAWRVSLTHTRLWTVLRGADIVGSASAAQVAYLTQETRSEAVQDATIKQRYLLAQDVTIASLLTSPAAAQAEATRQLLLRKVSRDVFEFPVPVEVFRAAKLKMMDIVGVTVARFGMDAGRLFRLIGFRLELARQQVVLSVWG